MGKRVVVDTRAGTVIEVVEDVLVDVLELLEMLTSDVDEVSIGSVLGSLSHPRTTTGPMSNTRLTMRLRCTS
ncbi:MAG: hypothetical protein KJO36_08555 [Acidimicrobiia bacterium]|nr:hypothetical protein [Acidimicrobiia bacterium]MBT8250498.1 hypothetical protein [Acidimicrobiia bacterium]NND13491.1 hypothetical protein [Acidimicrobiia bacterium]NNL28661.1 hypothetical protein [Acidimicrobiia bacterium]